jgi:hypothetical protein
LEVVKKTRKNLIQVIGNLDDIVSGVGYPYTNVLSLVTDM